MITVYVYIRVFDKSVIKKVPLSLGLIVIRN